jgi:hypothetical protein
LPITSSPRQPNNFSAAGFIESTMPRSSIVMMPSTAVRKIPRIRSSAFVGEYGLAPVKKAARIWVAVSVRLCECCWHGDNLCEALPRGNWAQPHS